MKQKKVETSGTMKRVSVPDPFKTPTGYTPVTRPPREPLIELTDSRIAHASATRNVVLQIMSEAFDLYETETMWLSYHLDQLFAPLMNVSPHAVPLAVRQELLNGTYSRLLELRSKAKLMRGQVQYDNKVLHATAEEWAEALLGPVIASYQLRPIIESGMRGQMLGLLTELGVGDKANPRGTTFLPTDLRLQVFANRHNE